MYVRKFEADSLDEALKHIKSEMGPDAIILKTVTNKGLKGAFKKKKIEITAAISEDNYTKKAKVDATLGDEHKEKFYNAPAGHISNMINGYNENSNQEFSRNVVKPSGYGQMGVNKQVQQVKKIGSKIKTGLDDFLSVKADEKISEEPTLSMDSFLEESAAAYEEKEVAPVAQHFEEVERTVPASSSSNVEFSEQQKLKIEELERQIFSLSKNVEKLERKEPQGVYELRITLKSLDIDEKYIQGLSRKAIFELSDEELENCDVVFEFALREMLGSINTALPLFSSPEAEDRQVLTVLVSDSASGQTAMLHKLAALKKDSVLIRMVGDDAELSFSEKVFGLKVSLCKTIAEVVSEARKATEAGQCVFIDYKNPREEINETKKFVDGLKRSFDKVEVLVSLSAIHSEIYNRKVINRYRELADGMVITYLDLCLNYGALFNISSDYQDLPIKFYGTGEVIPDDIEAATAERMLGGIFNF